MGRFYVLSSIILLLIILGFIIYTGIYDKKIITKYLIVGLIVLLVSFILISFFYWKISFAFFLIPFAALIITDISLYYIRGKEELKGALDESTALRNLLHSKESELNNLQKEIKESGKESSQLAEKINSLQSDIKKLKGSEEDGQKRRLKSAAELKIFMV